MARTLTTLVVVGLAALVAVACATVGRDFDRTNVNNIKPQVHDKAQIKAWFGEPTRVTTTTGGAGGCKEMWIYQHGRSTHGGAKTNAAALAVVFDENGKVCESAYSEQKN
jgi:hypothetical protein